jgi:hypothetical protein
VLLFLKEMGGGAAIGLASGYALLLLFRRLETERSMFPAVAVGGALVIFGGAQVLGASGFLAVYLAGVVAGNYEHSAREPVTRFFGALGWLAQVALFLMLGLPVTPHQLPPLVLPALAVTAVLILVARPSGVASCLLPFRWTTREVLFASWVGLRALVQMNLGGCRAMPASGDMCFITPPAPHSRWQVVPGSERDPHFSDGLAVTCAGGILAAPSPEGGSSSNRLIGDPPEDAVAGAIRREQFTFVEAVQSVADFPLDIAGCEFQAPQKCLRLINV